MMLLLFILLYMFIYVIASAFAGPFFFFFFKQKTAYEMRISDWSSDVCSSDLSSAIVHLYPVGTELRSIGYQQGWFRVLDPATSRKIGRASCRERVCQYV